MSSSSTTTRRPGRAMILAAGLGTRLRPITDEVPKPLVEVLGAPLLAYAMTNAARAGARVIAVNTHHLPALVEDAARTIAATLGVEVRLSPEPVILGTGGGIKKMRALLPDDDGPIYVQNADALIDLDTDALVAAHAARAPLSTMVLKTTPDQAKYGVIGVDDAGRVRDFVGRVPVTVPVTRSGMFCGVHLLEEPVLDVLDASREMCINREGYPTLLGRGAALAGFFHDGDFWDVGTPDRLIDANRALLDGRAALRFLDGASAVPGGGPTRVHATAEVAPGATLVPPVLVGPHAVVEDGAVAGPFAVLGRGARVEAAGRVSDAVVLASARVEAGAVLEGVVVGVRSRAAR